MRAAAPAEIAGHVPHTPPAPCPDSGFETDFHIAGDGAVTLLTDGEYHYDHIVLLAPSSKSA